MRTPPRNHHGRSGKIPHAHVSHQPGFRVHRHPRFRAHLPNTGAGAAGRRAVTSVRRGHGNRPPRAQRASEPVPVEGTKRNHQPGRAPCTHVPAGAFAGEGSVAACLTTTPTTARHPPQ